jgi:predicted nucleotidyltransferase
VPKNRDLKNAFQILEDLAKQGYETVHFIVGGDRVKDFKIIESDARKKGISGTDMRNYVKDNDFESFKKNLPSKANSDDAVELFRLVKKGMKYD